MKNADRLFHNGGPNVQNARRPNVTVRVHITSNCCARAATGADDRLSQTVAMRSKRLRSVTCDMHQQRRKHQEQISL